MKRWEFIKIGHHKDVGKIIEEYQEKRWRLHTYNWLKQTWEK